MMTDLSQRTISVRLQLWPFKNCKRLLEARGRAQGHSKDLSGAWHMWGRLMTTDIGSQSKSKHSNASMGAV